MCSLNLSKVKNLGYIEYAPHAASSANGFTLTTVSCGFPGHFPRDCSCGRGAAVGVLSVRERSNAEYAIVHPRV